MPAGHLRRRILIGSAELQSAVDVRTTFSPQITIPAPPLEEFTRRQIHDWIEDLLEEECAAYWATASERRAEDAPQGYGNGHGKPRHLAKIAGTIERGRPRVHG